MKTAGALVVALLVSSPCLAGPQGGGQPAIQLTPDETRMGVRAAEAGEELKVEANREFLGVKFGMAFGAVIISGRVDEAAIVGTGQSAKVAVTKSSSSRPVILLECHKLVDVQAARRTRVKLRSGDVGTPDRVSFALGPFLTIQSSQDSVIEGIGFGVMAGLRAFDKSAFNVGVGLMLDPSAKILAEGFKDGQAPPDGATSVLFAQKSKWGPVVLVSFAF